MKDMQPEVRSVTFDDISMQYLHYPGGEKTIIFLHATGFLPWIWHPVARHLAGEYTVIAPYICDHRFAPHEEGLSWMLIADDFRRFCEKLEIAKPYFVGHSMGGTIIAITAGHHLYPVEKMVMIEPIFLPETIYEMGLTVDQHPLAAKAVRRKNFWSDREAAREYLRSKPLFRNWDGEMLEIYLSHGMVAGDDGGITLACHPHREAALFMGSVHFNPWPLLSAISCPTLVLEGETSENRQFIDLKKLSSLLTDGQYRQVQGAGHLIPMEKPAEIGSMIKEFFS